MTISLETRSKIKGYLEGFVQGLINIKASTLAPTDLRPIRDFSEKGEIKPFHESILPDGILRTSEFERSFSTKLGATFEECAQLIALENFEQSKRKYRFTGSVSAAALSTIDSISSDIDDQGMQRHYHDLTNIVANSYSGDMSALSRPRIFDLYLKHQDGTDYFFEMKSPKPNKDQCTRVTSRLLLVHAIKQMGFGAVKTFYAMTYNPFGNKREYYDHSFAMRYLDMEQQVLIGEEFWDLIGGQGTYDELLDIYREVGREKGPELIDLLLTLP